jgi:hypothetical protein
VVQGELGRFTIATGQTGLEGFNRMPGPRAGVSWLIWAWAITGCTGGSRRCSTCSCRPSP